MDVVVQRFEGRDIEDAGMARSPLARDELMNGPQEGRKRFAAPGRGRNEHMVPGSDHRPGLFLNVRRLSDMLSKPILNQGMEYG